MVSLWSPPLTLMKDVGRQLSFSPGGVGSIPTLTTKNRRMLIDDNSIYYLHIDYGTDDTFRVCRDCLLESAIM